MRWPLDDAGGPSDRGAAPASFPELLDGALPWALRGPWATFWWAALPVAIMSATGAALAIRASQVGSTDPFAGCGSLALLIGIYPVAGVTWIACFSAMVTTAWNRLEGRSPSPGEAFGWVLQPRIAITLATAALAVLLAALLSFFLLFFGGLVVTLLFAFTVPVMLDRGSSGFTALASSARLAWRNPSRRILQWPMLQLLALALLQFVMGAALQILVSLPYQVAVQLASFRDVMAGQLPDPVSALGPWIWIQVPVQIAASLVQSWVLYYIAFALGMLYRDLRARSSASDLEREIEHLLFPAREESVP